MMDSVIFRFHYGEVSYESEPEFDDDTGRKIEWKSYEDTELLRTLIETPALINQSRKELHDQLDKFIDHVIRTLVR